MGDGFYDISHLLILSLLTRTPCATLVLWLFFCPFFVADTDTPRFLVVNFFF